MRLRRVPSLLPFSGRSGRIRGIDLARFVALAGMAATHIYRSFDDAGTLHPSYAIAAGRASALFAVLAGVSLVLAAGGGRPSGGDLRAARVGALFRAALLLSLGLLLGLVDSPPLVILAYYAVLFALGTAVLGASFRTLAWLAVAAALVTPQLSHVLRQYVDAPVRPDEPGGGDLFLELFLTGTYPALTWTTYLLAGMAVARADLRRWWTAARLLVVGAAAAVAGKVLSAVALEAVGGPGRLYNPTDTPTRMLLEAGRFGTTPAEDARWLTVAAPHTGTTFDLVHTTGTALLVLGVSLIVARLLPRTVLYPLLAAGSMTLTLYTLHVLALADWSPFLSENSTALWVGHVVAALVLATIWRKLVGQGPLEAAATRFAAAGRASVARTP